MRKYIFVDYNDDQENLSNNLSNTQLWNHWNSLQQNIDQENNKYEWNRIYMLKNIQDLTIMVDKKTNKVVGFYMAKICDIKKIPRKKNNTKAAPKSRNSRNNTKVPKGGYGTITIDLIQAFDQEQGYGTLMLIHAAQKVGMKYHNTDNLKNYIRINDPYEESIGFYEKYNLLK